jgi:hypothetical protein
MTPDGLEDHFYFGGGASSSNITPLGIIVLILACLAILLVKRKWMVAPFLLVNLLMPVGQVIVLFGLHISIWRFVVFVALLRIGILTISGSDPWPGKLTLLDKVFTAWAVSNAVMYTILWSDFGAFINRAGFLYTCLGTYFLFRYLVRDREDLIRTVRVMALVMLPIALAMVIEHSTAHNPLAFLGAESLPALRDGRVRAQGPFLHAIIAGTIGAVQLPLFVMLWFEGKGNRLRASIGAIAVLTMVYTSSSSTPLMAFAASAGAVCLWPLRRKMRIVRWGLAIGLIGLQLTMKAPVWYLMNRVAGVVGGTGWHRADLIDQFVRRFSEWWLVGTRDNANWGLDMWDAINGFVRAGLEGGLLTFLMFLGLFIVGYSRLGKARAAKQDDPASERLYWALGCSLFSNTIGFLGIIYFDQSAIIWYLILVMISASTTWALEQQALKEPEVEFIPAVKRALPVNKPSAPERPVPTYRNRLGV